MLLRVAETKKTNTGRNEVGGKKALKMQNLNGWFRV